MILAKISSICLEKKNYASYSIKDGKPVSDEA